MKVLVLNGGSTGLKAVLFAQPEAPHRFSVTASGRAALDQLDVDWAGLDGVGHRVVHGGERHQEPTRVTSELLDELRALAPFDPTHLPAEIALIEEVARRRPELPQVACFDTAFHSRLPLVARLLPLPRRLYDQGIRRYGFHGLSYQWIAGEVRRRWGDTRRLVIAHLGGGASLAALRDGVSVDTTMGFSPTAGVPMATRSGDVDPGVLAFLVRSERMTAEDFTRMCNQESGLLGVSGQSGDLRALAASSDPRAAEAIALFCYEVKKRIGAFAAVLGGLDRLVFTGGIGEHSAEVRAAICQGMGFLGLALDPRRNAAHELTISPEGSTASVHVIPTDEEQVVLDGVLAVLGKKGKKLIMSTTVSGELLAAIDAYWRAANYLSVGQIYLLDNPLLREPLRREHIKPRLLGHWGTTPGLNFVYAHLNRVIKAHDLDMIFIAGPGHGGPAALANVYLEGTYSDVYPEVSQDERGMARLFRQFSFPGGVPSHVAPETPGSIHEGGELGYALSHAYGAAFDNPDLVVACVIGDGEAETGALATSWHSNKFLEPGRDGAVLPILHLNGYKIAGPTVLARIPRDELTSLMRGYGHEPLYVDESEPALAHRRMATVLDECFGQIREIQRRARSGESSARPRWPMIVLDTPKGWTGPHEVDGKLVEGTFRAHQVPIDHMENPEHVRLLESWMKSYRPETLFDEQGRLRRELAALAPSGDRRMGANPHANGGLLLRDLRLPDFRAYAVDVPAPGARDGEATRVQGQLIRDVVRDNRDNFRIFSPDETNSNRWNAVFEVTDRVLVAERLPGDDHVAARGQVMEVLSEHQCQGWLEGYLLTGRHGFFSCYEAFIHIIDSMFNQHAKWLKTTRHLVWRRPIASLNYLLTSHVWRQDHNGFSHQDPGFIDHVVNKKAEVIRVYLPPDANTLLSVTDHCLRSRNYVNVVVAGKQVAPQWLTMDEAVKHCTAGIGIWSWASNDQDAEPDVVMACCGDVPTLETLAAVSLLRKHLPELKIRVVNVVDLMKLQPASEHPHGLSDREFDALFTPDKPIIFAFHGYPWLIHRLAYRRTNHGNLHVRGYKEEGTTTTPFDMTVLNDLDRYHLAGDAVDRLLQPRSSHAYFRQMLRDKLIEHRHYVRAHGEDMPEVKEWRWDIDR